jgi:hypothetical protein
MEEARAKQLVEALIVGADALYDIARTASRNKKRITGGGGSYAQRFHDEVVKVTQVEKLIAPVLQAIAAFDPASLNNCLTAVKATGTSIAGREEARRSIRLICQTEVVPNISNLSSPTQPASEPVLAAAVLANAPTYLKRTLLQANGSYEKRWFDASSVMIRKLVENLIIDVYEKHKKQSEIQKDGEYFMLAGLITAILGQTHWPLQRETKQALPGIKKLGDRAAHNRRYEATRQDIDQILPGLRATVDDLLHLAGHK